MEAIFEIIHAVISLAVVRFFYGTDEKPAGAVSRWIFRGMIICAFAYSLLGIMYLAGVTNLSLIQKLFPISDGLLFFFLFTGWALATAGYYGENLVDNKRVGYAIAITAFFIPVLLVVLMLIRES